MEDWTDVSAASAAAGSDGIDLTVETTVTIPDESNAAAILSNGIYFSAPEIAQPQQQQQQQQQQQNDLQTNGTQQSLTFNETKHTIHDDFATIILQLE